MATIKKRRTNKNNIMKKIILVVLTALMMVGCEEIPQEKIDEAYEESTFIVDSCEYIHFGYSSSHKGNCRFCEERDSIEWEQRKKEVEELVIKIMENYYGKMVLEK